jgi:hypothetical protein
VKCHTTCQTWASCPFRRLGLHIRGSRAYTLAPKLFSWVKQCGFGRRGKSIFDVGRTVRQLRMTFLAYPWMLLPFLFIALFGNRSRPGDANSDLGFRTRDLFQVAGRIIIRVLLLLCQRPILLGSVKGSLWLYSPLLDNSC